MKEDLATTKDDSDISFEAMEVNANEPAESNTVYNLAANLEEIIRTYTS